MKAAVVPIITIFSLLSLAAMAQIDDSPTSEIPSASHMPESTTIDDKPLLFENEIKAQRRDSAQAKWPGITTKPKADHKPSSSKDGDALSFNFLYYIIQKFKISDLVDD
jgi:hypothetical protein